MKECKKQISRRNRTHTHTHKKQCQIWVIFIFTQTPTRWQLFILAAIIDERCFSHYCAHVPKTITAEWECNLRGEESSARMMGNVLTCKCTCIKTHALTALCKSLETKYSAIVRQRGLWGKKGTNIAGSWKRSEDSQWCSKKKIKICICISMRHSIIILRRGS